jgi:hypothetical protein
MHIQERTYSVIAIAALALAATVPVIVLMVRGIAALGLA